MKHMFVITVKFAEKTAEKVNFVINLLLLQNL